MPIQPIYLKIGPYWPNRQCCLAGSSKIAPRIFIFSIAMGADYSFYVKSIATFALTFCGYIISVLASVQWLKLCIGLNLLSWNSNMKLYLTSSSGSGKGFGTQTRNLEICALLQILGKRVGETGQVTVLVRFWVLDTIFVFFGCIADTWH